MTTRRDFLTASAAAAGLAAVGAPLRLGAAERHSAAPSSTGRVVDSPPGHPLRILILGGTSFLGPHQIAYAMGRGHTISTFTRGRTVPSVHGALFDDVEMLIGDRQDDLDALRGRTWDAVLDNSGRQVEWTRDTAELLTDSVETYLYVSSTGVYYPYLKERLTEDDPAVLELPEGTETGQDGTRDYGVMKAQSELAARAAFGDDRTIAVRPTYMMGPGDQTDRFTYWPVRLALGGDVMIPGAADQVQYIDVRDVAGWMIRLVEQKAAGTWNAVGPASVTSMEQFVHGAHAAFGSQVSFTPIDDNEFLRAQRLSFSVPWIMPWGDNYASAMFDNRKCVDGGMTFRPLAQSVRDIHDWWETDAVPQDRKDAMLTGARSLITREPAILEAWRSRG